MNSSPASDRGSTFAGQVVAFAGKLASLPRRDAQALVARLGGEAADDVTARTTYLVVGDNAAREEDSARVRRADQINAREPGRIRIVSEGEFCRAAGIEAPDALREQFYGVRDIRNLYPIVTENHLRYLEKWGLIRSVASTRTERFYPFTDLTTIKQLAADLVDGLPLRSALRARAAAREGQLELDFHASASAPAKVVTLHAREARRMPTRASGPVPTGSMPADSQSALAARYFLEGSRLDDGDEQKAEQAAAAYRKALVVDPTLVPAIVNLANLHYAHDELIEAQALYERAIVLDPECFEPHFNLANIHHDLGRFDDALVSYRDAVTLNPGYADAHFYLAVTLEKTGRSADAKAHWKAYQELAPNGEWIELAKEFSD